jgi:bacterioferritin
MMIFGFSRIPIVSWFQSEAQESLTHAQQAGELITRLGGHPSLGIGPLLETHQHDMGQILRETLEAEHNAVRLYYGLLELVADRSVALEEYARDLIRQEEEHIDTIDKMLRKPGDVEVSKEVRNLS